MKFDLIWPQYDLRAFSRIIDTYFKKKNLLFLAQICEKYILLKYIKFQSQVKFQNFKKPSKKLNFNIKIDNFCFSKMAVKVSQGRKLKKMSNEVKSRMKSLNLNLGEKFASKSSKVTQGQKF